jgi:hypothetical protein
MEEWVLGVWTGFSNFDVFGFWFCVLFVRI